MGGKEIQVRDREMGEMRRREGLKRETLRDVDQRHRDRIPEEDLPNPQPDSPFCRCGPRPAAPMCRDCAPCTRRKDWAGPCRRRNPGVCLQGEEGGGRRGGGGGGALKGTWWRLLGER